MRAALVLLAATGCSKILGIGDLHGPGAGPDAQGAPIDGAATDGPQVAASLQVTGRIQIIQSQAIAPGANISVVLLRLDDSSVIAETTSDVNGVYTLTVATGGAAVPGYVRASTPVMDPEDSILYFPGPLTADTTADILMATSTGIQALAAGCAATNANPQLSVGLATVMQADHTPKAGLTLTTQPAPNGICYFNGPLPSPTQTQTSSSGQAIVFNIPPGAMTISAALGTQVQGSFLLQIGNKPTSYLFPVVVP